MSDIPARTIYRHASHWGPFSAVVERERIVEVQPVANDPCPSPLIHAMPSAVYSSTRIREPMVRKGWLEAGPGGAQNTAGDRTICACLLG